MLGIPALQVLRNELEVSVKQGAVKYVGSLQATDLDMWIHYRQCARAVN